MRAWAQGSVVLAAIVIAACGSTSSEPAATAAPAGRGSTDTTGAPRPLPPSVSFEIAIPGRAGGVVSGTLQMDGLPWAIVGCPNEGRAACEETMRFELSPDERSELVVMIEQIQEPVLCEPEAFAPGDPEYALRAPAWSREGHLAADPARVAERTGGTCGAPARLAWWIVQRFQR